MAQLPKSAVDLWLRQRVASYPGRPSLTCRLLRWA